MTDSIAAWAVASSIPAGMARSAGSAMVTRMTSPSIAAAVNEPSGQVAV